MEVAELDQDPRGVFFVWEPPSRSETYIMGIDVALGRTGWNRYNRVKEDRKTDNGTIEIIRIGKNSLPDVQVAEYAAPVDPFELGQIANVAGRVYAGLDEDQCKCIIEVTPGPGFGTLQEMMQLGYVNHFRWEYFADTVATPTRSIGWHASNRSNRDLWVKSSRHINLQHVIVKSPFLVEEYADCHMNVEKGYGENPGGHDDRVRAFNLAIWCGRGWSMEIERTAEPVRNEENVDFQRTDATWSDVQSGWLDAMDRMSR